MGRIGGHAVGLGAGRLASTIAASSAAIFETEVAASMCICASRSEAVYQGDLDREAQSDSMRAMDQDVKLFGSSAFRRK
jgi:hypothetical protein